VVGPLADDPLAGFGSYTFPRHVLVSHPEVGPGLALTPFLDALREELPGARVEHARGCGVQDEDRSGFAAAVECARSASVAVAVLGDLAGLFGRGSCGRAATRALCGCPEFRRTCSLSWSRPGRRWSRC